ncbi:MAG: Gfo/Idh/MocA family protein [Candidatus Hodarchaeales archaeon]|jgi:predicted dehydrogenase
MKKHKVAVIGVGRMGRYHVRILSRLGALAAIADLNEEIGTKLSSEYSRIPFFSDYKEMIDEVEPDGVILATPTQFHFPIAKEILQHYSLKGLLIEKPISSTIKEGEELLNIASNSNTSVSVGHIEVYNPVVSKMIELYKQGAIGDIRSMIFQRRGAVSDGRLDSIGDVYQDIGIHDFDIASRFLSGTFYLSAFAIHHHNLVNSSTIVLHNNQNNVNCTFLLSREFAGKIRKIELEGTKATMIANLLDQFLVIRQLGIAKGDTKSVTVPYGSGEQIKVYGEPLLEEIWQFLDTMNGVAPVVSIEDGIKSLKIVESARLSSETNKQITVTL